MQEQTVEPILRERIKKCCQKHYEIFASALLAIAFVSFLTHGHASNMALGLWVFATTLVLVVRFVFIQWFNSLAETGIRVFQIHLFTIIMAIWGVAWGWGTILFFPLLSMPEQSGWFAMFMVMIAASATSHCVYMRAFFAFSIPYFLGMLYMVATQYPSAYHINAVIVVLIMVTQVGAAKKGQNVILESLKLRFENIDLIQSLQTEKQLAEKAHQSKSKFLASASHDLRQPLYALSLFSNALENAQSDPVQTQKIVKQINGSIEALQNLFNALLDISRLDAGTLPVEKKHFDIQSVMEAFKRDFVIQAKEKDLNIVWDQQHVTLYSDPTLVEVVLRNLISNAIRYTESGEIKIQLSQNDNDCRIDVVDSGVGIAECDNDKIFEEFVQLNNPERDRSKGLGLGLSIVKRIVQLLGHEMLLESVCAKGTTFSLVVEKGHLKRNSDDNSSSDQLPNLLKDTGTVLVIDDEISILEGTETLLEGWGYEVICAIDVHNAVQGINESRYRPDFLLVDYRLREEQTGIQAIKQLRQTFGINFPALLVTGDTGVEQIRDIHENGFEVLHKPVRPAQLRSYIRKVIGKQTK